MRRSFSALLWVAFVPVVLVPVLRVPVRLVPVSLVPLRRAPGLLHAPLDRIRPRDSGARALHAGASAACWDSSAFRRMWESLLPPRARVFWPNRVTSRQGNPPWSSVRCPTSLGSAAPRVAPYPAVCTRYIYIIYISVMRLQIFTMQVMIL